MYITCTVYTSIYTCRSHDFRTASTDEDPYTYGHKHTLTVMQRGSLLISDTEHGTYIR